MAKASPPVGEIRKIWSTSLSLSLSLSSFLFLPLTLLLPPLSLLSPASASLASPALRSERNAIHCPSGDHCGELSWLDWVNCVRLPVVVRYSHSSLRKIC